MSNIHATRSILPPPKKTRPRNPWLIVSGVVACLAIVLIIAGRGVILGPSEQSHPTTGPKDAEKQLLPEKSAADSSAKQTAPLVTVKAEPTVIDDDGKTLWVSPTSGPPLDLAYLAPGTQIIVAIRPAALLKHAEGAKIRAALGPVGQRAAEFLEKSTGHSLAEMERIAVGCQATSEGKWLVTLIVHLLEPISRDKLTAKFSGAEEKSHGNTKYWLANERAYYLSRAGGGKLLVVTPAELINDIIDLAGNPPPLRRDIERLIDYTDSDRDVTIVLAPNSLFSEGQSMFVGQMSRLRQPLFWFLGDELSGAALSLHWDDNFFLELIATPTLDTLPEKASRIFADRVAQIPDKLEEYVVSLNPQPYGRHILSRFPAMFRKMTGHTRSGFEADHAVLRCYLPAVAGHNLLMGAELTLAEPPGAGTQAAGTSIVAASHPAQQGTTAATAKERLAKVTSLKFARDTLESALEQLSQDIGVPIVIRGPDLQADGITKNQSFGIDIANKPAEQILVEILRLANPDKSSTGPTDVRQKLVYIIEQKPDKTAQVVITTRAKVKERKDQLPAAFQMSPR
jgi:hypothetical protein